MPSLQIFTRTQCPSSKELVSLLIFSQGLCGYRHTSQRGRLAILAVESIIRKPAPKLAIHLLNLVGVVLIALLMIVVTYHDIARLVA